MASIHRSLLVARGWNKLWCRTPHAVRRARPLSTTAEDLSVTREPREVMEYDVLIVGAGPAGLSAAIRLKQLEAQHGREVSVCVVEKAAEVGGHIVSGNVFEPRALDELLPDWRDDADAPLKTKATEDKFLWLTSSTSSFPLPTPPSLDNQGNFVCSLSQVARWLATKAEELGAEIYPGFAASEVLYDDAQDDDDGTRSDTNKAVVGVATRDVGLGKDNTPKATFARGVELRAKQTIFAEGARGSCSEQVIRTFGLRSETQPPQTYGLGIKEVWKVPLEKLKPGYIQHTLGWPLHSSVYGGSFLYHMGEPDLIQIGFVVGLDYGDPTLSPYKEFQRFKHHPAIKKHLEGGECVGYGARVINEGGFQAIPEKLAFPGGCLVGCGAGFVNVPKIKGTHTAMKSGMLAAEAVFDAVKTDDVTQRTCESYDSALRQSWVYDELRAVRNYKPSFELGLGMYGGALYSGLSAYVLGGKEPWTFRGKAERDADATWDSASISRNKTQRVGDDEYPKPDGKLSFALLDNLARTGVDHENDQPSHLRIKPEFVETVTGKKARSLKEKGAPERNFCPAGVYEYADDADGDPNLVINAQNCIHCQCCAIKTPFEYIDWTVPEGGGGPAYTLT